MSFEPVFIHSSIRYCVLLANYCIGWNIYKEDLKLETRDGW